MYLPGKYKITVDLNLPSVLAGLNLNIKQNPN